MIFGLVKKKLAWGITTVPPLAPEGEGMTYRKKWGKAGERRFEPLPMQRAP